MAVVTMEYIDCVWAALVDVHGNETDRVKVVDDKVSWTMVSGTYVAIILYRGRERHTEPLAGTVTASHGDSINITVRVEEYF